MKLLIADDSLLVRNTLKRLLKAMALDHMEIIEAKSGKEAIDVFEAERPQAMILDLLMPEVDGEGVLREIEALDHTCFISVLTSNVQEPVKQRCLELGADIFMEKPITQDKMKYFFIKMEKAGR